MRLFFGQGLPNFRRESSCSRILRSVSIWFLPPSPCSGNTRVLREVCYVRCSPPVAAIASDTSSSIAPCASSHRRRPWSGMAGDDLVPYITLCLVSAGIFDTAGTETWRVSLSLSSSNDRLFE